MKSSSPKKQSGRKNTFFLFAILALCACFVAGGYCINKVKKQQVAAIAQKKYEAAQLEVKKEKEAQREKRKAEIQGLFDTYLNAFESEIAQKAEIYKKTRNVLKKLIRPANFKTTGFAKENYDLFKEGIAPSLREKSEEVVSIFERYSEQIENELTGEDNDLHQFFLDKWQEMTKEQLDIYVDFFAREEEMIQAYDDLITFYYTHSRRYTVDEENNKFVFTYSEDEAKAQELLERALELQKPDKKDGAANADVNEKDN